jgi:hypothetical protein
LVEEKRLTIKGLTIVHGRLKNSRTNNARNRKEKEHESPLAFAPRIFIKNFVGCKCERILSGRIDEKI